MLAHAMQTTRVWNGVVVFLLLVLSSCGRNPVEPGASAKPVVWTDRQIASLEGKKVFFGHQSVGANIIQGVRDLVAKNPRLKLKMLVSAEPQSVSGPAFIDSPIGENGKPQSKNDAFTEIIAKGLGAQGGFVLYKYCYVDIDSFTDIQQMFERYRKTIDPLKRKYPLLKIVHITVPLTAQEPTAKAWIKTLLGRTTERDVNVKRNAFNTLLRQAYAATDPIFDLADAESTGADGSRSYFVRGNDKIYVLASEFTSDGSHLNEVGRRAVAERLLLLLAEL
jgi:lysophospholipase L1-like esterase